MQGGKFNFSFFLKRCERCMTRRSVAVAERPRDASAVQYLERRLLLVATSALDLTMSTMLFCFLRPTRRVLKTTSSPAVINKVHWCVIVVSVCCDTLYLTVEIVDDTYQSLMPKPDIGRESRFLPTPPALDAPVRRKSASEYCHNVWYRKTRMLWEYTNVRDGLTVTARRSYT